MELGLKDLKLNSTLAINDIKTSQAEIIGLKLDMMPILQWVRVLEQIMLVILLVGRWLLPKGKLTREQLSQLLLAYMAMAADVIELFECFNEDAVIRNVELIYATLAIWSWSLLQFTLVLSATHAPKQRPSINFPPPQEVTIQASDLLSVHDLCNRRATQTSCSNNMNIYLDMDIVAILTTIFMQDGPFFLLRMTLIFGYKVVSYLNIFFTCKNTLIVSLQMYRLFVLCSRKRILNRRRKELLDKLSPSLEESEEEGKEEEDTEDEVYKCKDIDKNILPPPPPQEPTIEQALEASLLEIIEEVGEEKILKELETLVSLNTENEAQESSVREFSQVTEPSSFHVPKITESEQGVDDFLPESDFQNSNGLSASPCKPVKKHYSSPSKNQEYIKQREDFQTCYDASDYASHSDTDLANDKFYSDRQGISVSSTSLADPFISDFQPHRWSLVREQCLPHRQQRHKREQKVTSVPSSLHRDPRRKLTHTCSQPPLFYHHGSSYSPEPHRRMKRRPEPKSQGGSMRMLCHGQGTVPWDNSYRHHSSFDPFPRYTGISESDADTLETNV